MKNNKHIKSKLFFSDDYIEDDADENNSTYNTDSDGSDVDNRDQEEQIQLLTAEEFEQQIEEDEDDNVNAAADDFEDYNDERSDEELIEENEIPGEEEHDLPPFDLDFLSTPLFDGSNLTIGETIFMIEAFSSRHGLTKVCIKDLLQMLQIIIGDTDLPHSMYSYERIFSELLNLIHYHVLCKECGTDLIKLNRSEMSEEVILCHNCNSANEKNFKNGSYIVMFDLKKQFKIFLEDPEIQEALRVNEVKRRKEINFENEIVIEDVYDASLYRNLKQAGNILSFDNNFSVSFNLDGASFFKSSTSSCWPIQLILNELPLKLRHRRLVLGGIWFGKQQPKVDTYLKIFCNELNKLSSEEVNWTNSQGEAILSKIVPLCCCVDSVARPKVMESVQFNGEYGCVWCYNPGRVIARTRRYPYSVDYENVTENELYEELSVDGQSYRERSTPEVTRQMMKAYEIKNDVELESERPYKGFKGISVLAMMPHFDVLWGCPPDEMHGPEEGVVGKSLFEYWFNRKKK